LVALLGIVSELDHVLDSNLLGVVDNVLIVVEVVVRTIRVRVLNHVTERNDTAVLEVERLSHVWTGSTHSFHGLEVLVRNGLWWFSTLDVFLRSSERNFAQQHVLLFSLSLCLVVAVVSSVRVADGLGEHVSKVDSSTEHASGMIAVWWGDSESSLQNTNNVGSGGSVPKEHLVTVLVIFGDIFSLFLSLDSEDVADETLDLQTTIANS
jgi:hypothetical protein